jgi:hypothetical protein
MKTRRRTLKKNLRFWPPKYYRGLTLKQKIQRKKEIEKGTRRHWKDPKAYTVFETDKLGKSKPSNYTRRWKALFPEAKSLPEKSRASGVPLKYIKDSYRRGMGAWRTGHRPFATEQQWGYARVHSFLLCGKTHYSTDSDLVRKAKAESASARRWWKKQKC